MGPENQFNKRKNSACKQGVKATLSILLAFALTVQIPLQAGAAFAANLTDSVTIDFNASVENDEQAANLVNAIESGNLQVVEEGMRSILTTDDAIDHGGLFQLENDLEFEQQLEVAIPEGETAVLDLAGHTLSVLCDAEEAFDTHQLNGTLVITDSAYDSKNEKSKPANIVFAPAGEKLGRVSILSLEKRDAANQDALSTGDAGENAALIIGNVGLRISGNAVNAETAVGLRFERGHGYLIGALSCNYSENSQDWKEQCLLFVNGEDGVTVMESVDSSNALSVAIDDLQDSMVVAHAYGQNNVKVSAFPQMKLWLEKENLVCNLEQDFSYVVKAKEGEQSSSQKAVEKENSVEASAASSKHNGTISASSFASGNSSSTGIDLYTSWGNQGTNTPYTITQGGTYYLSKDLSVSASLTINAPGKRVVLDLNNHALSSSNPTGTLLAIAAASEVSVTGNDKSKSKISLCAVKVKDVISSSAEKLIINNVTVEGTANDEGLYLRDLDANALRMNKGSLEAKSSDFIIDMSNQANSDSNGNSVVKGSPSGIVFEKQAADSSVSGSTIKALNSSLVPVRDGNESGYAYGIYSETEETVKVSGSSIQAVSALGSARGMQGQGIVLEGVGSQFELESSQQSFVAYSSAKSGITLNASVSSSFVGGADEDHLLCGSVVESAFVFGSGFSCESSGVLVGKDKSSANDDGVVLGSFLSGVDKTAQNSIAAMMFNALDEKVGCDIQVVENKIIFALIEEKAVVQLVSSSGKVTSYATVKSAVAAAEDGDRIDVLQDNLEIVFEKQSATGKKFSIDLKGHTVSSLSYSGDADLTVYSSGESGQINGLVEGRNAGVFSGGTGNLTLKDLNIVTVASTSAAHGIYSSSSATLTLDNVDISVSAARSAAYGIRVASSEAGVLQINDGSITVSALSAGVGAYGIRSASRSDASIAYCEISADGMDATVHGIDVAGSITLKGNGSASDILAISSAVESSDMSGIYMGSAAAGSQATLDSCAISVSGASSESGWCLSTGNGASDPAWILAGDINLKSSTNNEVEHKATPILFEKDFSATSKIHVVTLDTSLREFAQVISESEGASIASIIAGSPSGEQFDYGVKFYSENSKSYLSWETGIQIANVNTGAVYSSFEEAFESANAGDTLSLKTDVLTHGALDISKTLTIDLNGKSLTVNAGSDAAAGTQNASAGVKVQGKSEVNILDSANGGRLNVVVGASTEKNRMTYQGFAVSDESSLTIDGAALYVVYGGATSAAVPLVLRGVSVVSGSFNAQNKASIEVVASREAQAFGASDVKGLWVKGSSSSVNLSNDTSLTVRNNAAAVVQGSGDYPDYEGTTNAQSSSTVDMLELVCDKNGALYKEICKKFLERAVCDTARESDRVFNTNIYYVTNMTLSNGMKVWAYSEPVESSEIGKLESIVPSRIFVRSSYATPLDAYGVYGEDVDDSKMHVFANVSAATTTGRSFAVFGTGDAQKWDADESRLEASGGSDSYLSIADNKFDLNDYFQLGAAHKSQQITYPKSASMRAVSLVEPLAQKVADSIPADDSNTRLGITESQLNDLLYPAMMQKVTVSFSNLRDENGKSIEMKTAEVSYSDTLKSAGVKRGFAKDYQVADIKYRFIGWRMTGLSAGAAYKESYIWDDLLLNSSVSGVTSGSVNLVAQYVPVKEGDRLVTFSSDHVLTAYSVKDGAVPSYQDCWNSADAVAPQKQSSAMDYESGYSYVFSGWAKEGSDETATSILSAVNADQTYIAEYTKVLTKSTIVYRYRAKGSDGSSVMTDGRIVSFDWNNLASVEIAKKIGDNTTINDHGVIYTLLGWSPRATDVEALYTGDFWLWGSEKSYSSSGYNESKGTFYAVYERADQLVNVRFFSGSTELGHADNVPATRTLSTVLSDAGIDPNKLKAPSAAKQYRGWGVSSESEDIVEMSITSAYDVIGEKNTLDLYVLWRTKVFTVTFYDSDKSKIGSVGVEYGKSVMGSNPKFKMKGLPSNFAGWETEKGKKFSLDEAKVYKNISLYATYNSGSKSGSKDGGLSPVSPGLAGGGSLTAPSSLDMSNPDGLELEDGDLAEGKESALAGLDTDLQDSGAGEGDDSETGSSSTVGEGNGLAGIVTLASICVILLALIALFALWLIRRRTKDEEDAVFELSASEKVQF